MDSTEQGWDFMDSTLQFSIVSSNSFVATNSNRDSIVKSSHFSLYLRDSSICDWGSKTISTISSKTISIGSKTKSIGTKSKTKTMISTKTISSIPIGIIEESWVSLWVSLGSYCQQESNKNLHCSSVA